MSHALDGVARNIIKGGEWDAAALVWGEGVKFWLLVLMDLKNRGVSDTLFRDL